MKRKRLDYRRAVHTPVVVLAGLPFPICGAVAKSIEATLAPTPRVIYQSSGDRTGDFY